MPQAFIGVSWSPRIPGNPIYKRLTSQLWSIKLHDVEKVVTYHFSVQSRHSPGRNEENDREFTWRQSEVL